MSPIRATAAKTRTARTRRSAGESPAHKSVKEKDRMVHIRLSPELHRKLRLVVAAEDTNLQDWIARTLQEAADRAWPAISKGDAP